MNASQFSSHLKERTRGSTPVKEERKGSSQSTAEASAEEITTELDKYDYRFIRINCTRHSDTKIPLSLFETEPKHKSHK